MNERIKELAEQAAWRTRMAHNNAYWRMQDEMAEDATWREKFAELILKEYFDCIDIMEKIANSTNSSIPKDYDKHTYLETLDTLRGLTKTHFGVE